MALPLDVVIELWRPYDYDLLRHYNEVRRELGKLLEKNNSIFDMPKKAKRKKSKKVK